MVAPRVGDVADMVASENGPLLYDAGDEEALFRVRWDLTGKPAECKRIGQTNRAKARAEFDFLGMAERYRALYWGVMDLPRPA